MGCPTTEPGITEDASSIIEQFNSAVYSCDDARFRKRIPVTCRHWLSGRCNVIHCRFLHEAVPDRNERKKSYQDNLEGGVYNHNYGGASNFGVPGNGPNPVTVPYGLPPVGSPIQPPTNGLLVNAPTMPMGAGLPPPVSTMRHGSDLSNPQMPPSAAVMTNGGFLQPSPHMQPGGLSNMLLQPQGGANTTSSWGAQQLGISGMLGVQTSSAQNSSTRGTPAMAPTSSTGVYGAEEAALRGGAGLGAHCVDVSHRAGDANRKRGKPDDSRIVCRHWLQNRCNVPTCRFMHSLEPELDKDRYEHILMITYFVYLVDANLLYFLDATYVMISVHLYTLQ